MSTAFHVDWFSTELDDLTRKQQADHIEVLRVLARTGRYSIFEATKNKVIAKTMDHLLLRSCITIVDGVKTEHGLLLTRTGGEYPWVEVALTEAGKQMIGGLCE